MFIRIIRTGDESTNYHNKADIMYECTEYHITPTYKNEEKVGDTVFLEIVNHTDYLKNRIIEIDKKTCEVYIMNNDGKTIDTFAGFHFART